ncbi:MAG: translation initiation factor IF-3 [Dehalococcoidia bacterium]
MTINRELRVNERIRARDIRLIGEHGEQLGIVSLVQALQDARERNLDLVEVAPTASPPVCRLMDYARWKYEQAKKEREARKNQKSVLIKEVRFRPKIDDHDIDFKVKQIIRFLGEGDKVKANVLFRGREMAHPQIAKQLLDGVLAQVKQFATVEKPASMEGRSMSMILAPTAQVSAQATAQKVAARESREPAKS